MRLYWGTYYTIKSFCPYIQPIFPPKSFDSSKRKGNTKHMPEKDRKRALNRVWYIASREPSDTLPGSQPCTQTHSIYRVSGLSIDSRRRLGSPWVGTTNAVTPGMKFYLRVGCFWSCSRAGFIIFPGLPLAHLFYTRALIGRTDGA